MSPSNWITKHMTETTSQELGFRSQPTMHCYVAPCAPRAFVAPAWFWSGQFLLLCGDFKPFEAFCPCGSLFFRVSMGVDIYHLSVGTGGSPKNSIVWWSKCNKTPLFTVFSAHTQIASMLMLREHMSCLFATIRRFFMTCVDTFSSQHIETA